MSKICPLFSGSTGNATYIESKIGSVLVDAGASFRALCSAVEDAGGRTDGISAVFVTHEHSDHIKGLKKLLKCCRIPLIASSDTLAALASLGVIPAGTETVEIGEKPLDINGIGVTRFSTSHDCAGSSGYSFALPDSRISICTDLGVVTDSVRNAISGSDAVLIESNHDTHMLEKGPYPPKLKIRIMSDVGHISNAACAAVLPELLKSGAKRFILGHLSLKNNTPLLAESCAVSALVSAGADSTDYRLSVAAPQHNPVYAV